MKEVELNSDKENKSSLTQKVMLKNILKLNPIRNHSCLAKIINILKHNPISYYARLVQFNPF